MYIKNLFTNSNFNNKRLLIYILASIVILYFIFLPGFSVLYYAGDDLRYAFGGWHKSCRLDDGFDFMLTLGRPLQAYMDCLSFKFAYTPERMNIVRIASVIILGCGMGLLADWLFSIGFTLVTAFFAAGWYFLINKLYGSSILMGANSLPFAVLFAILGYRCLLESHALSNKKEIAFWLVLSAIFIFCGMLTYPAMAFFFPVMPLTKLLFSNLSDWVKTRRELIREVVVFGVVCVIYFAWAYYNMHYHPRAPVGDQYNINHPNLSVSEILQRLAPIFKFEHGPWVLFPFQNPIHTTAILLLGGIVLGIVNFFRSDLFRENKKLAFCRLGQSLFFFVFLFLLCSAFYLIIPKRETMESQILFGTAEAGIPILLWCIFNWSTLILKVIRKRAVLLVTVLFFIVKGSEAHHDLLNAALGHAAYINATKTAIARYSAEGKTLRRIHFIIPHDNFPYDRFFVANAALIQLLGRDNYAIKWCSLPRGIPGDEKDHVTEMLTCLDKLPQKGIAITYSYDDESYKTTEPMLVIKNRYQDIDINNL